MWCLWTSKRLLRVAREAATKGMVDRLLAELEVGETPEQQVAQADYVMATAVQAGVFAEFVEAQLDRQGRL